MNPHALGVLVSATALHGVLVEQTEEGPVVQFQVSLPRASAAEPDDLFSESEAGSTEFGDESGFEDESDDVTIQFGDDEGGDMFLGSEFEDLDTEGDDGREGTSASSGTTFQATLEELLDECAQRGYEDPEIAFCTPMAGVDDVELRLPADVASEQTEGEQGLPLPVSQSRLLEMLEEQYEGGVDEERVGFVPMHQTGDGRQRVLALIARPGGEVLSTLSAMREQTLSRTPRSRLLDTEVPLYLGLARSVLQLPPDTPEKTIVVRVGAEDTLVLFMEGNSLRQAEHLPELTVEDPAETICSRVLLLQDEYGVGELQHVLLSAEREEEELRGSFKSYFSNASLRIFREHLPQGEEETSGTYVAPTGMALRLLEAPEYASAFQSINLLPTEYTKSPFRLPVGWSIPVLLTLLGITTLGFVWYYFANANAIGERRTQLRTLEQQIAEVDVEALQRRTDSLESAAAQYERGLGVIDTLLKGSNRWSKGLATVAQEIDEVGGVSLDEWRPQENEVRLAGRSTGREAVVRLLRRLGGDISSLVFTEVREATLFEFEVTVPLDTTKPDAVSYWREEQLATIQGPDTAEAGPVRTASVSGEVASRDPSAEGPAQSAVPGEAAREAEPSGAAPSNAEKPSSTASASRGGSSDDIEALNERPWTLVVASLVDDASARTVAQTYRERLGDNDYAVRIQQSPENGRYRVGIGSFPSLEAAQSVLRELGDRLPEETWMHRIDPAAGSNAADASSRSTEGDDASSEVDPGT